MIIDTHIHLYDKRYQEGFSEIIAEALTAGVSKMIAVGFDYESSRQAIALAEKYKFIYAAVGLHPSDVKGERDTELLWLKELSCHSRVVAIGEIGLDYHWDKLYSEMQMKYFVKQIEIAKIKNLPIIVHSRDAALDTYNILMNNRIRGVLHCYAMSLELARDFVAAGYYLGIGGVLTFKNSKEIKRVVSEIGLEFLLSETDGPYLAPEPYRGQLNKPSYIRFVVEKIAEIKKLPLQTVINKLYKNAQNLFNL